MIRRQLLQALIAVVGTTAAGRIGAADPAADTAYRAVASWLFDLYLERSIQLSVFNVQRVRPGADRVLAPRLPAMVQVLARHRPAFIAAMERALRQHLAPSDATTLAARIAAPPVVLDDPTRSRLVAVDSEFRRESQSIIRAVTADLGGMIEEALTSASSAN